MGSINLVEDFKTSILEISERDGKTTWPIDLNSISHLFIGEFDKELLQDIEKMEYKGHAKYNIGQAFVTPQRIIRLLIPFVQGLSTLGLSRELRREKVEYLLSLVHELKHGDPSNRDGKNIVLSPDELNNIIGPSWLSESDKQSSLLVHKLCGILWAYVETLFFKTHGLVREFHGPYTLPGYDGNFLFRDFVCLKPTELWEESSALPFSRARIVAAYDQLDMSVDIYNHVSIPEGRTFIESLKSYYVECDGKILEPSEIDSLCKDLSTVMRSIHKKVESLEWQKRAEKYADIFWYSKKQLRDILEEDWAVPEAVRQQIQHGEISTKQKQISQRELQIMMKLSF